MSGEKKKIRAVSLPQIVMMAAFATTGFLFPLTDVDGPLIKSITNFIGGCGLILFVYCVFLIYFFNRGKRLITDGPYKYTRHPMYTGLFLMDLSYWVPLPANKLFYLIQVVFIVCLIIAAYFQEQETIARFGEEAKEYYKKTPRLFFCYPFVKRDNP